MIPLLAIAGCGPASIRKAGKGQRRVQSNTFFLNIILPAGAARMGSSTILSVFRSNHQKGGKTSLATRGLDIPELNHNMRRVLVVRF